MQTKRIEVTRYQGGNQFIDHLIGNDEVWWIVQGPAGRKPVEAATSEEAKAKYVRNNK